MKKFFLSIVSLTISFSALAQKDVTKFLGIPVDGYKHEMIQKLKEKGFVDSPYEEGVLQGEFNGSDVNIYMGTVNNKVYRIMVADRNTTDERNIQIRFNNLCHQFSNNPNYLSLSGEDYTISDDENLSYEINVNKKRYEAIFYQKPDMTDSIALRENILARLSSKYTEEQLNNPSEDLLSELTKDLTKAATDYTLEVSYNKPVWFMIAEHYGEYYICMFYENEYNKASGEDL